VKKKEAPWGKRWAREFAAAYYEEKHALTGGTEFDLKKGNWGKPQSKTKTKRKEGGGKR